MTQTNRPPAGASAPRERRPGHQKATSAYLEQEQALQQRPPLERSGPGLIEQLQQRGFPVDKSPSPVVPEQERELEQLERVNRLNAEQAARNQPLRTLRRIRGHGRKRGLTEEEAAFYIGMSRSYLRQDRMHGRRENRTPGPRWVRIGRAIRYLKDDLDSWLEQYRVDISPPGAR